MKTQPMCQKKSGEPPPSPIGGKLATFQCFARSCLGKPAYAPRQMLPPIRPILGRIVNSAVPSQLPNCQLAFDITRQVTWAIPSFLPRSRLGPYV